MPHHSAGLARKCHKTLFFHPLTHNYLRCVFLVPKHDFSDFFPKVSAKPGSKSRTRVKKKGCFFFFFQTRVRKSGFFERAFEKLDARSKKPLFRRAFEKPPHVNMRLPLFRTRVFFFFVFQTRVFFLVFFERAFFFSFFSNARFLFVFFRTRVFFFFVFQTRTRPKKRPKNANARSKPMKNHSKKKK